MRNKNKLIIYPAEAKQVRQINGASSLLLKDHSIFSQFDEMKIEESYLDFSKEKMKLSLRRPIFFSPDCSQKVF